MKTKRIAKKLTLRLETLERLTRERVEPAAGGFSADGSCFPVNCNIDSDPC